jgi:sec-independent protein translocase protein TatA
MALDPLEIAIVVGAIAIFLVWGPAKIPELARSLGRARGEFSKAQKESTSSLEEPKPKEERADDELILVAQSLGISTEGKTKSQLAKEIIDKKSA